MKKILKLFVVFVFVALLLTSAKISHAHTFTQPLKPFSSGEDVSQLQFILSKEGFFKGNVNGNYGKLTVEAVRKYQAKHGIEQVGVVGPKTLALLNGGQVLGASIDYKVSDIGYTDCFKKPTVTRELRYKDQGKDVVILQTQLDCYGFANGINDGFYGRKTAESVASFQKSRGLPVNGYFADKETLEALDIVLRTENSPEIHFYRSPATPPASFRTAPASNVPFVEYILETNSNAPSIIVDYFHINIRQVPGGAPVIRNLRLEILSTPVNQTIPMPVVNNFVPLGYPNTFGPFSVTVGTNPPVMTPTVTMGPGETKIFRVYFDIDPSAAPGTVIDTEEHNFIAWPQIRCTTTANGPVCLAATPLTPPTPLAANPVTIISSQGGTGTITLNKTVSGGPSAGNPSAFTPLINGSSAGVSWGVLKTVQPGTYTIGEQNATNYTSGLWTGSGCTNTGGQGSGTGSVTIVAGQNVVCDIINTYSTPPPVACSIDTNSFTVPTTTTVASGLSTTVSWSTSSGCRGVVIETKTGMTEMRYEVPSSGTRTFTSSTSDTDNTLDISLIASDLTTIVSQTKTVSIIGVANPSINQCTVNSFTASPNPTSGNTTLSWSAPASCNNVAIIAWTPNAIGEPTHAFVWPSSGAGAFPASGSFTLPLSKSSTYSLTAQVGGGSASGNNTVLGTKTIDVVKQ